MTTPPLFSAVVLAAGRSARMGREKALLETGGGPLWQRQRDLLAQLGAAEIFLSVRPEQAWARSAPGFTARLHDVLPDCGPIGGLTAALERAAHPHVVVLAVDLPRMTAAWLETLLAGRTEDCGAVGRRDGFFEPLAALYPKALMPLAWEALARGDYALQPLLAAGVAQGFLRVQEIDAATAPQFENWNEPSAQA
ncbi:MAG: molybdenum cofactor guanylyltransferase [Opitutales bacterium]